MDEDTLELIQRLCTRAGMIMEDASAEALATPADAGTTSEKLVRLAEAAFAVVVLIAAAKALQQPD